MQGFGTCTVDGDLRVVAVSGVMRDRLAPGASLPGAGLGDEAVAAVRSVLAGAEECSVRLPDGRVLVVEAATLDGGGMGACLRLRDGSPGDSELLAALPDYVVLIDSSRKYKWINRIAEGLTRADLEGKGMDDFIAAENLPTAIKAVEHTFATGEPTEYSVEGYGDGVDLFAYRTRVVRAPDENGEPRAFLITQNVTAQRQAERALRDNEELFRNFLERLPDYIVAIDDELRVRYVNRITPARADDDPLGQSLLEFVKPVDRERVRAQLVRVLEHGEVGSWESTDPRAPDLLYSVRAIPVSMKGDLRALVVATDVTEERQQLEARRALERQLEQAQRLESIGLLAGGIAHDFNNLLTVIVAGTEMARRRTSLDGQDDLNIVRTAADKAAGLVQKLLAFGRRKHLTVEAIDVSALVGGMAELARRVLPENITLEHKTAGSNFVVKGDAHQLEQILLNLCVNARDAMPNGGRIQIRTTGRGEKVCVDVMDTGHGIPESELERIFEPFYTTKSLGEGTGLGLSTAHGIVQQHGGTLTVESEVGKGTAFHLVLPGAGELKHQTENAPPLQGGSSTVLLAEDEDLVRQVVSQLLESAGYRVLSARDGREALELFQKFRSDIDIVILDAVMPRLNGRDCFDEIRRIDPDVPIIFATGYAPAAIGLDDASSLPARIITKPFQSNELLRALHDTLADRD